MKSLNSKDWDIIKRALAQFPQCNGASIGLEDDFEGAEVVLNLHVAKKLPIAELAVERVLPQNFAGFRVRVIESNPKVIQRGETSGNLKDKFDRLMPGVSVGGRYTGSLACVTEDEEGQKYGLTNAHVVGEDGDKVYQPGLMDAMDLNTPINPVGVPHIKSFSPFDLCYFKLLPGVDYENSPYGQSYKVQAPVKCQLGEIYQKVGRTTGFTRARCVAIGIVNMNYSVGRRQVYAMTLVPIKEDNPLDEEISMGGDSGSLWCRRDGAAAGLHFAGEVSSKPEDERGYACPMDMVLSHHNMKIADSDGEVRTDRQAILDAIDQAREGLQEVEEAIEGNKVGLINLKKARAFYNEVIKNLKAI